MKKLIVPCHNFANAPNNTVNIPEWEADTLLSSSVKGKNARCC